MNPPQNSSPPAADYATPPDQPPLLPLVLQSKKALQHGEQLCSRANGLSNTSADGAVDIFALDAQVRWITDAVLEQLKLAAGVAKSIEDKRAQLDRQIQEWDLLRTKHNDALETVLESLGAQYVPPEFHQSSSEDSIFVSQLSDDEGDEEEHHHSLTRSHRVNGSGNGNANTLASPRSPIIISPSATLRSASRTATRKNDRKNWKTLRDFVDDRAIENALENIDNDRLRYDEIRTHTIEFSSELTRFIQDIRDSLPELLPLPSIENILNSQDVAIHNMARILESLASHYGQMDRALKDSEAGEEFSEEDIEEMNRDTDELPKIIAEIEESEQLVESTHEQLMSAKVALQEQLTLHPAILDDLDELAEHMEQMLHEQQVVEGQCLDHLHGLHSHLVTLEHLHQQFISYRTSFNKLLLEIARRKQYQEAAEKIVSGMMSQLRDMTQEEKQVRQHFNAEHGVNLPEDLCLCIANSPTKWDVVPKNSETVEVLPHIDEDLLVQARDNLSSSLSALGPESL